jgi:23S rRNA-/tRNA-specific pseudouridylate synthase
VTVRLVVREGEPRTVGDLLSHHGIDAAAVSEGRVFLGAKRVKDALLPVKDGDEVAVETARERGEDVRILAEHRDLHAVWKPAGLPTEPDRSGTASAIHSVAKLLGVPPNVLHAATRLDAQVSGITIIARGAEAARFAAALKQDGRLGRRYIALASRAVEPREGTWDAAIGGDASSARGSRQGREARAASSRYAVIAEGAPLPSSSTPALLVVEPITGRTHQIRLHAAGAGAPLLGDVKYGGPRRLVLPGGRALTISRIALHAARIHLDVEGEPAWTVTAPLPDDLAGSWTALGGDPAECERALAHSFHGR